MAIILQVTVECLQATLVYDVELVGNATQQMTVMGHDHHGAGKLLQRKRQGQAHLQVEVVGGLVEQQKIGTLVDQQRQHQARLLATREGCHRLHRAVAIETETAQEIAQVLVAGPGIEAQQVL